MARYLFGGVADYVVARGDSATTPGGLSGYTTVLVPDHPVTFWDAPTGGNQYTDLLDLGGTPIPDGVVETNSDGALPQFYGPEDVVILYADAGGDRRALVPVNAGEGALVANAAQLGLTNHEAAANPHQMGLEDLTNVAAENATAGQVLRFDGSAWTAEDIEGVTNAVTLDDDQEITGVKIFRARDVNTTPVLIRFDGDRIPDTASVMRVEFLGVDGQSPPSRRFEINERGMLRLRTPEETQVAFRILMHPAQTADAIQVTDLNGVPRAWVDAQGRVRAPNLSVIPAFGQVGSLATSTGGARWYNDTGQALTIRSVRASVGTAPDGGDIVVDVNVNGVSIFSSPAAQPTIPDGGNTSGPVVPAVTTVPSGGYITVDIDQVGSVDPGADLTVQVTAY